MSEISAETRAGRWWLAAALGLTLLAYWQTQHFSLVSGDRALIFDNPRVQYSRYIVSFFTEHSLTHIDALSPGNSYQPVSLLWRWLNHQLWGPLAAGWHWSALLMHLLTTALVFLLAREWMRDTHLAGTAAMLFGLHPVNVEAVAWISGVDEALVAAPLLACAYFFLRWKKSRVVEYQFVALGCFAVALLAKENAIVLPALLLAMDSLGETGAAKQGGRTGERRWLTSLRNVAPFVGLLAVYLIVRGFALGGWMPAAAPAPLSVLLLTLPSVLLFHLRLLLWPVGLSHFYDLPLVAEFGMRSVALPAVILIAVGAAFLAAVRRWPAAGRAGIWLVIPLLPLLNLAAAAPEELARDRALYLPSVGFCLLLATALRHVPGIRVGKREVFAGAFALPFLLAAAYGALTVVQAQHWRDNAALHTRGTQIAPLNSRAGIGWADELFAQSRFEDAALQYARMLARHPEDARANFGMGSLLYAQKKYAAAAPHLERAAELDAGHAEARVRLAQIRFREQRFAESEQLLRQAIALRPSQPGYRFVLGTLLEIQKRPAEALQVYREELLFDPWRSFTRERIARLEKEAAPPATP